MSFPTRSLPEALCDAAARADPRRGYTFVSERGERFCSFAELHDQAARHAAALLRLGLHQGDRVALALPTGTDFVFSFLGALHAGLVPVPMYPPQDLGRLGAYLDHARHVLSKSEARALVTAARIRLLLGSLAGGALRELRSVEELGLCDERAPLARLRPEDPAFVQFTSGSTARPKGVVLSHGNLAANVDCITRLGLEVTDDDVGCSWLPLFHDMGLVGFVLAPVTTCTPVVLMDPLLFLKRPVEWLRLITRHRASIGFSPNFGYGLCASRVRERDREGLDLRSWRGAGCGAEAIQLATLERFAQAFAPVGFDRRAFRLCYGLAESTLAVSFSTRGLAPRGERVARSDLAESGVARPVDSGGDDALTLANCGRPFPGHELAVLDADGRPRGPREVGEIVLRGPSVMQGYIGDPQASAEALRGGWLRTGDLGYLVDGELYVCGRIKELIVVAGRNYHPADVEWVLAEVPGVRRGRLVAFGLPPAEEGGLERLVVVAESKARGAGRQALVRAIETRVLEAMGLKASQVVLVPRGALPRTSSGKLQRARTRELYLAGALERALRREGRAALLRHLVGSQWGLLRQRVGAALGGARGSGRGSAAGETGGAA